MFFSKRSFDRIFFWKWVIWPKGSFDRKGHLAERSFDRKEKISIRSFGRKNCLICFELKHTNIVWLPDFFVAARRHVWGKQCKQKTFGRKYIIHKRIVRLLKFFDAARRHVRDFHRLCRKCQMYIIQLCRKCIYKKLLYLIIICFITMKISYMAPGGVEELRQTNYSSMNYILSANFFFVYAVHLRHGAWRRRRSLATKLYLHALSLNK